jgi:signal transduction histidine kinase
VSDSSSPELVRLQEENAALKKRLSEMQRMTALGELVSTTTHEFNNVLMTIINYAKMGIRYEDKATRDKAFAKIDKAGARAAKITNAVLGMARNRSEQFEPTSLEKLIDESMVLLEREMQKYRIAVEFDYEAGLPEVPVIGNQIQQVLMNLLINARQAMQDGGRLIVRLKRNLQTQTVDLSVRDFGPGIAQEKLRRIFEPFYSTKQGPDETGKGGTGVGLSTCKNIIDAHGGKIRVDSTVGKGTCFTLMLPIKTAVAAPKARGLASVLVPENPLPSVSTPATNP